MYSNSLKVYLLDAQDLSFCYAILRNDKIRQSDNSYYTRYFRTVSVQKCQLFIVFLSLLYFALLFCREVSSNKYHYCAIFFQSLTAYTTTDRVKDDFY